MIITADETLDILAQSSLCRGMPRDAVTNLAGQSAMVERAHGEEICREGAGAVSLFLIVRGVVKLVRTLENGRDVIIELLGRGDVFGESALADGATYDTCAACVHPSTVLMIPRDAAWSFLGAHPDALRNLLGVMNDSVVRAHGRVEDLAIFGVRQRIARFLIRLAEWAGRVEQERTVIPVALSRQEIAALVGTTMETAIRVMSGLRKEGLVSPARRGFVLLDRGALESLAQQQA